MTADQNHSAWSYQIDLNAIIARMASLKFAEKNMCEDMKTMLVISALRSFTMDDDPTRTRDQRIEAKMPF